MSDAPRSWPAGSGDDGFAPRRPMRAASTKPAPRARALPDIPRRVLIIAVGLTGSVLLAATIIWGISRMGPRSTPLIEADGRPFRVRPENLPPQPAAPAPSARGQARPDQAARLAPAPEAPRTDALRQQVEAAAAPPAPTSPAAAPATAPATAAPVVAPSTPPALRSPATASTRAAAATPAAPSTPAVTPRAAQPAPAAARPAPPPPAAARPAPAAPAAAPPGRAEVQFGALASEDAAKLAWDRLKRRVPALANMQPRISRMERNGQPPLWRLRVATTDVAAARSLCEQARAKNAPCVPV